MNPPPSVSTSQEAARLLALHDGKLAPCMATVSSQFLVIQGRSQLLLTLATITLTITGFSGPRIAASGLAARSLLAAGLVIVLAGVVMLLISLKIHWLPQFIDGDPLSSLERMIAYRNRKTAWYTSELVVMVLGLSCYVGAVVVYLITGDPGGH